MSNKKIIVDTRLKLLYKQYKINNWYKICRSSIYANSGNHNTLKCPNKDPASPIMQVELESKTMGSEVVEWKQYKLNSSPYSSRIVLPLMLQS